MAAAFLTQTVDAKLSLANKLARAEALVRYNVQRSPVSYQADAVAAFLGGGPYHSTHHSTHGCLIGKG